MGVPLCTTHGTYQCIHAHPTHLWQRINACMHTPPTYGSLSMHAGTPHPPMAAYPCMRAHPTHLRQLINACMHTPPTYGSLSMHTCTPHPPMAAYQCMHTPPTYGSPGHAFFDDRLGYITVGHLLQCQGSTGGQAAGSK